MTLSSLISLISLSTADLLCYQVLTCEAVIPKGRFQSITAGILLRIYTLASCSNCGMTKFYISLLFALLSFLLPYCGFAAKIGKKSILKCVLVAQSPKKFFSGRATSLKSCFFLSVFALRFWLFCSIKHIISPQNMEFCPTNEPLYNFECQLTT